MPNNDARPKPTEQHMRRDLGDEYIFYDQSGDQVHVLNGSAREIYLLCDGSHTVDEVADVMVERFEVDRDIALADARSIVNQLIEKNLLAI